MNNALVILYEGQTPNTGFIERLGIEISNTFAFGGGDVKVMHFDQTSIAKSLVGKSADVVLSSTIEGAAAKTADEAILNAVTYIREKFKDELSTGNNILFIMRFQEVLSQAKARKAFNPGIVSNEDEAIINATELIRENAQTIVLKHKLSKSIVNAIVTIAEHL